MKDYEFKSDPNGNTRRSLALVERKIEWNTNPCRGHDMKGKKKSQVVKEHVQDC